MSKAFVAFLSLGMAFKTYAWTFEKQFKEFQRAEKAYLQEDVKNQAAQYHYVFIPGFLNEGLPTYFEDNITALEAAGIKNDSISVFNSSSFTAPSDNVHLLQKQMEKIPTNKKIVMIGHSKGAVEGLLFAIENKEFVQKRVQAVFLVQGAFLGSPIADYIAGKGHAVDSKIPFFGRMFLESAHYVLSRLIVTNGLLALTSSNINEFWGSKSIEPQHVDTLDNKVFYIKSRQNYRYMSLFIDNAGRYLETYYGDSDGIVILDGQSLSHVGRTIATIEGADHTDLMLSAPLSNREKKYRFAFTNTLLTWLVRNSTSEKETIIRPRPIRK